MTPIHDSVVQHFLYRVLPEPHWRGWNWGTGPCDAGSIWDVDADTYINGVALTVDADYMAGYLLEVVDRRTLAIHYVVVTTYHGPTESGHQAHDSAIYPGEVGMLSNRFVTIRDAALWAVDVIDDFLAR